MDFWTLKNKILEIYCSLKNSKKENHKSLLKKDLTFSKLSMK